MTKSRVSLPVIPYSVSLFQDLLELDDLLLNCQKEFTTAKKSQIVSFSYPIPAIDPLIIIKTLAKADRLHFFWEKPDNLLSIAAVGHTRSIKLTAADRFVRGQEFIQNCLDRTVKFGDSDLPISGPLFCCNFTFFSDYHSDRSSFPPGTIFLPRLQVIRKNDFCLLIVNLLTNEDRENLKNLNKKIRDKIYKIDWKNYKILRQTTKIKHNEDRSNFSDEAQQFKSRVSKALEAIEREKFTKIVIARTLDIVSPQTFNLVGSLDNLRSYNPDCYTFSVSNGKGTNFIGASPERLISIADRQLITDTLAGSAPRGKTIAEDRNIADRLLNSEKELREHEAVRDYIIQSLLKLGLEPARSTLQLLKLSNIQHLWTPISAKIPTNIDPLDIVAQLHPTPAVAGVPTAIALQAIKNYETFDRSLYAAPIGWIDYSGNSEFIVGIRSASISGDTARLYAGNGIVAGSHPDKELAEVQLKLQSLLKALVS
ncbi:MAG: isochorismate synthase MenF [Prochloraceae cyanobacterium]